MRVRGLKHTKRLHYTVSHAVAPRAGAWVETHLTLAL